MKKIASIVVFISLLIIITYNCYGRESSKVNDLENHKSQAYAFANAQQYDEAIKEFSKALVLDRENAVLYNDRGVMYLMKGDLDRAKADFTKAMNIEPEDGSCHMNIGNVYARKKQYDLAIVEYDKALKLMPRNLGIYPEIILNKAKAYEQSGRNNNAIDTYKQYLNEVSKGKLIGKGQEGQYRAGYERGIKEAEESIIKMQK